MTTANEDVPEQALALQQIIAKACTDKEFRERALKNPHDVLTEHGIMLPDGHQVEFVECTPQKTYISLPAMMDMG